MSSKSVFDSFENDYEKVLLQVVELGLDQLVKAGSHTDEPVNCGNKRDRDKFSRLFDCSNVFSQTRKLSEGDDELVIRALKRRTRAVIPSRLSLPLGPARTCLEFGASVLAVEAMESGG